MILLLQINMVIRRRCLCYFQRYSRYYTRDRQRFGQIVHQKRQYRVEMAKVISNSDEWKALAEEAKNFKVVHLLAGRHAHVTPTNLCCHRTFRVLDYTCVTC